jgi:hypothetical protein
MGKAPLSDLHAMLEKIGRERHARRLNRVANHPEVAPWIRGSLEGELDFTPVVQDDRNYLLMSQHGGLLFTQMTPGIFEAHTSIVPEGRGEWALNMVRASLMWMFTRTDMMELVTRCPRGNLGAISLARAAGCQQAYVTPANWQLKSKMVPSTVFTLTLQQWLIDAPGLIERGQWVEKRLGYAGLALTKTPDPEAYRYMGLAFEMFQNAQVSKGLLFLKRWLPLAGHGEVELVSADPTTIGFRGAMIVVKNGDFYIAGADRKFNALC